MITRGGCLLVSRLRTRPSRWQQVFRCFSQGETQSDPKQHLFKEYHEVKVPFHETRPYDKQKMNTTSYKVSDPQEYVERVFAAPLAPGEKKVMFIRHAISEGNTLNLIYGLSDYPLTDKGQEQAKSLQPTFSKHKHRFCEFVCSGLQRTRQTGGLVLGLGITPTEKEMRTELNFNEYDFGPLEGIYSGKMDYFEHEIFFQL